MRSTNSGEVGAFSFYSFRISLARGTPPSSRSPSERANSKPILRNNQLRAPHSYPLGLHLLGGSLSPPRPPPIALFTPREGAVCSGWWRNLISPVAGRSEFDAASCTWSLLQVRLPRKHFCCNILFFTMQCHFDKIHTIIIHLQEFLERISKM